MITDVDGQEVRRLAYRAFGEEVENTGTGEKPPYTYTGKELDDTGLRYYGARYYDPVICRFLTPDTVYDAGPQGLNRYSYALNNPILYRDPTGYSTGVDPETGRLDLPIVKDVEWVTRPTGRSPDYRWYEDIPVGELQGYQIPCWEVAKLSGVEIHPGYGHVEDWFTTADDCAACAYRPAKWWEPGLNYLGQEGIPNIALAVAGYSSLVSSSKGKESLGDLKVSQKEPLSVEQIKDFTQNTLDISSQANGSVFWSGGINRRIAQFFAKLAGKTTLEQTIGGQYIDSLKLFKNLPGQQAAEIWDIASERFAAQATGNTYTFRFFAKSMGRYGLRTWWRKELPILLERQETGMINKMEHLRVPFVDQK